MENIPETVKNFITYLVVIKGKSQNTANEYLLDLKIFLKFLFRTKEGLKNPLEKINISNIDINFIKDISIEDIYEFLSYLVNERKNGPAARARKISSIRSFFRYLNVKRKEIENDPSKDLDSPKLKKSLPKFLTLEESVKLLKSISGSFKERDYLIFVLFLNCGMRLSELVNINLSDIRDDGLLRILGKGNKERFVYLNDMCREAIKRYRKVRPNDKIINKNALFLSRLKKRISNKTVQHIVYKFLRKIGIGDKGYSVHKLRHTAATLMYQHSGTDIRVLKEILGHENLGTTEIYTHVCNEQVKEALVRNPLTRL